MLKKIIKFKYPTQKHKILCSRRCLNDFSLKAVFLFNGYFYATFSNIYTLKMPKIGSLKNFITKLTSVKFAFFRITVLRNFCGANPKP